MQKVDFDNLREWMNLPEDQLELLYSETTKLELEEICRLLGDEAYVNKEITVDNFVEIIFKMGTLLKEGSRNLGDAIIQASEYTDEGFPEKAKLVYMDFIKSCPSKFYKQIAENRLKEL